jgi:formamidopyrimidine-DNA glycosylase
MPELPEVENFRQLLVPLISTHHYLRLERHTLDRAPPRKFLSDDQIQEINSNSFVVSDVLRKGKLICLVLLMAGKEKGEEKRKPTTKKNNANHPSPQNHHPQQTRYLFVHMGMTGRISTPQHIPKLVEVADTTTYPPSHTYLRFIVESRQGRGGVGNVDVVAEACFSDPRKFGSILFKETMEEDFTCLAPDAWVSFGSHGGKKTKEGKADHSLDDAGNNIILRDQLEQKLVNQSMGIKALLLDQKRVVSGVGNWIADEVMYQCELHPDQNYLTIKQAHCVMKCLGRILDTAVHCLTIQREEFPADWLFHYRWSKGKAPSSSSSSSSAKKTKKKKNDDDDENDEMDVAKTVVVENGKDAKGRTIAFVTSGGRTSAIVPTIQKKKSQKPLLSPSSSSPSKKSIVPTKGVTADMVASTTATSTKASPDNGIYTTITTSLNAIGMDQKKPNASSGGRKRKISSVKSEKGAGDSLPRKEKTQPVRTTVAGTRRSSRLSSAT